MAVEKCANKKWRADVQEKTSTKSMNNKSNSAFSLNVDNLMNTKQRVKVVDKSSRLMMFGERMKKLSPHRHLLKRRMRENTVSYVDLF